MNVETIAEALIRKTSDSYLGNFANIPVVASPYVEPVRKFVCLDRSGVPVGLEFTESSGAVERWIVERLTRIHRRNEEYLMTGSLQLCGLCTLPIVDGGECEANQHGSNHEPFTHGGN